MRRIIWPILMLMLLFPAVPHAEQKPDDRDALAGLKNVKVVFDVRAPDLEALVFNLELFDETWEGMVAQGIQPEMVVAFRGTLRGLRRGDAGVQGGSPHPGSRTEDGA